jgi:glycosyltransferase involved in cell wall biosynthesis
MSCNISVVLATYNGSKYIVKQLDSILNQTVPPDEIIICDDISTDETVSLLQPYLLNSRIKLFVNDKRLGVVDNFKKGAKLAAKHNWLAFADQDDIWVPEKLYKLANAMELIDDGITPSLVYSDLIVIDKNDVVTALSFWDKQKIRPAKIKLATILYGNVVTGCTMLVNYAMAEELFVFQSDQYFHDEWLGLIAYSFGHVKILNETLVLYRQHESNVTFSEEYKPLGLADKMKDDLNYLLGKKKFLSRQFELAKEFLSKYQHKLNEQQIQAIKNFIRQENKNYFFQRLNRRITYR